MGLLKSTHVGKTGEVDLAHGAEKEKSDANNE